MRTIALLAIAVLICGASSVTMASPSRMAGMGLENLCKGHVYMCPGAGRLVPRGTGGGADADGSRGGGHY